MRISIGACFVAISLAVGALGCEQLEDVLDMLPEYGDDSPGEADGRAKTLASAAHPGSITANSTEVVYAATNAIWRIPKAGGEPTAVYDQMPNVDDPMTVDDKRVYWGDFQGKVVRSVNLDGLDYVMMAEVDAAPQAVANDDAAVYLAESNPLSTEPTGAIRRVDKSDNKAVVLAPDLFAAWDVAVNDTHVFFTDATLGGVYRVAKAGGTVEPLATGLYQPRHLVINTTHVYFNTQSDLSEPPDSGAAKIMRVAIGGGDPEIVADNSGEFARPMAMGDNYVYWLRDGSGIWRAPLAGGSASKFALAALAQIAFVDGVVYWSDDRKDDANDAIRSATP